MKRSHWLGVMCLAVGFAWFVASAQSRGQADPASPAQPRPNDVADIMVQKMRHAERVLEALALADFDTLAKESQALSLLSQEAGFKALMTAEYAQQSIEFRRSANALTKAAKEKNIDAAALAYMDMTMKCVNCHKHVRDVRMAALPALEFSRQ